MKILVTGSNGFIGKNLIERLSRINNVTIFKYHRGSTEEDLVSYIKQADFVFHLAGVNRTNTAAEFYEGNIVLTKKIVDFAIRFKKKTPILIASSIHAGMNNDYGKSKKGAEEVLRYYYNQTKAPVFIYRLPNVFGKWARPNYNSVIATWCYNISRDIPLKIDEPSTVLELAYIDDVVESFVQQLQHFDANFDCKIGTVYHKSLEEIVDLLEQFKKSRETLLIPRVGRGFERALYATYLSYLPADKFSYELKGYSDERGTFYEILKTLDSGQFSISTTKPGDIVRGNHYHNTKNEKILVVKGKAIIELRNIYSDEVVTYKVSDKKMEVVEMIPGYTHNIKNISNEEMILFIWANEIYDHDRPDTFVLKV